MSTYVRVVTDSAADLPPELIALSGVRVVPLTVRFGDEYFADGVTLDPAGFWARLGSSTVLPETASPSPHQFEQEIKEAERDGAPGCVIVCMSAAVSAAYQSAVLAAERASEGAGTHDVATAAKEVASHTNVLAALDTLEFLERGGRIGSAGRFLGNLLDVKPLLTLENGVVAAAGRVRSRRAALDTIAEHVLGLPEIRDLSILHGSTNDMDYLVDAIAPRIDRHRIVFAQLGPVIGTHTGPGALGVAYRTR